MRIYSLKFEGAKVTLNFSHLIKLFPFGKVGRSNVDFSLLSLNARGIRTFEKPKAILSWLFNSGAVVMRAEFSVLNKLAQRKDALKKAVKNRVQYHGERCNRRQFIAL